MAFSRLIAILPCYAIDDILKEFDESMSSQFHAVWSSLWHPSLIALTGTLPEWKRIDASALDVSDAIVFCPKNAASLVEAPYRERLSIANCILTFGSEDRSANLELLNDSISEMLGSTSGSIGGPDHNSVIPRLSTKRLPLKTNELPEPSRCDIFGRLKTAIGPDEFFALGFAYLVLQALTRKVHYSSNLDLVLLTEQVVNAAKAYVATDLGTDPSTNLASGAEECERWLQAAFDLLSQERDRYFSQSVNLIDLSLVADTTLGKSLVTQLDYKHKQNFLLPIDIVEKLVTEKPDTWKQLVAAQSENQCTIIGGGQRKPSTDFEQSGVTNTEATTDQHVAWQPLAMLQHSLDDSRRAYQSSGIKPPTVFADFETNVTNDFPMHLKSLGYQSAVLFPFSDGKCPTSDKAKILWESNSGNALDTINGFVVDANTTHDVISMVSLLAKQFDYHQVPTIVFTHWPNRTSLAFNDFYLATSRTMAFGKWSSLDDYFQSTAKPYANTRFALQKFSLDVPTNDREYTAKVDRLKTSQIDSRRMSSAKTLVCIEQQLRKLIKADDSTSENNSSLTEVAKRIASAIPRSRTKDTSRSASPSLDPSTNSIIIFNPLSGPRRYYLSNVAEGVTLADDDRIYASHVSNGKIDLVLDVPPVGLVQLRKGVDVASSIRTSKSPPIGSKTWLLANEFIECQIDPSKGYLRSLLIAKKRGSKMSGMPAISVVDPTEDAIDGYATPENVTLAWIQNTPIVATIEATGDLVFNNKPYGQFCIRYELWRGARHIQIDCQVTSSADSHSNDDLWCNAPVWRWAWPGQAASTYSWIHGVRQQLNTKKIFAPEMIELDDSDHKLYITTDGNAVHRRVDSAFIDTRLSSQPGRSGSSQSGSVQSGSDGFHRLQLALDWNRPYQSYLETIDKPIVFEDRDGPLAAGTSVWFAQSHSKNVQFEIVDHCRFEGEVATGLPEGSLKQAMRLMVHETAGKSCSAKLSFFQDVKLAKTCSDRSVPLSAFVALDDGNQQSAEPTHKELGHKIEDGAVILEMGANSIEFIDLFW